MSERVGFFSGIIKGALTAVMITLFGVLIFAVITKFTLFNDGVVKAVNQFIKILSIFLGCAFNIRGNNGLIKGGALAFLSTIIIYSLFSLFCGTSAFNQSFFIDLIFTIIIGAISGIIAVNAKK